MGERWRKVVGFEDYRVSNEGRVQNRRTGRILLGTVEPAGYAQVKLRPRGGKAKTCRVHRLVCLAFHGIPQPGLVVNHIDGRKQNNFASNLEWLTRGENVSHAARLGLCRGQPGELNPKAKLRAVDVVEMRRHSSEGATYTELGRRFGVAPNTAYRAIVGHTWRHLSATPS